MKLKVGQVVEIHSAAGVYEARITKVKKDWNAAMELCEWYNFEPTTGFSSDGSYIGSGRFNEHMANALVKATIF